MVARTETSTEPRYRNTALHKRNGATYTPNGLSRFVARQIIATARSCLRGPIRILDPAVGDGELLISLLEELKSTACRPVSVFGFETSQEALRSAASRLSRAFPEISLEFVRSSFLDFVTSGRPSDFPNSFELIIANPPYVRTQVMGAPRAQIIAKQFGLSGRVDLYYAFVLGILKVLGANGTAGVIVSNRFMTTQSGGVLRRALLEQASVRHVWDLGDTKLFDAAVLPAVLLVQHKDYRGDRSIAQFTSIYETPQRAARRVSDALLALDHSGIMGTEDGRNFLVRHGTLHATTETRSIWRLTTPTSQTWLRLVQSRKWKTLGELVDIRVGVKTCADHVFIRSDWNNMPEHERPELLHPLTTHHVARRFKALSEQPPWQILYPHRVVDGKRVVVDLAGYPRAAGYLERHRAVLERRTYLRQAGRKWYEIWVPQDPEAWNAPKVVFREIAKDPTFWMDMTGTIVNGDCYWFTCRRPEDIPLLWLAAAVGNSTFIETFYDYSFHNKLYAGRRRFLTQYVAAFPLPNPNDPIVQEVISTAQQIYSTLPNPSAHPLEAKLDELVWRAFGLSRKEVSR